MANIEQELISKLATTGRIEESISRGIRADHFADEACRDAYLFITEHTRKWNSPPSIQAIETEQVNRAKQKLPEFKFVPTTDALGYIIDQFIKLVKRRLANEYVIELAKACDDPKRAEQIDIEFLEVSRKLATVVPSTTIEDFRDMDKRIQQYDIDKKEGKKPGIPFGFPSLDKWTGGLQPHEFAVIAGFLSTGKSTLLKTIAFNMWLSGKTPLYISLEEEARAILRKFDAMAASLNYKNLKFLNLTEEERENWIKTAERVKKETHRIPIIDSLRHVTPDHVYAETVRHAPDVVIIDYLSLMRSSAASRGVQMWQSMTEITQDLKQNARTLKVPIIAAAQTNRSGGKDGADLDNIGYALSINQDPDISIGLFADEDMKSRKVMEIRVNKNRDGKIGKFEAIWDHEQTIYREKNFEDRFGGSGDKDQNGHDQDRPNSGGSDGEIREGFRGSSRRNPRGDSRSR